jgi:isopentenyl-diphosphate delta-isomerase
VFIVWILYGVFLMDSMDRDLSIGNRKLEHIDIVINKDVDFPDHCDKLYNSIILVHKAFPEIRLEDIDLSINFLGYKLRCPVMITGMTGGLREVIDINEKLASIAEKLGIAIGVGSQRAMLIHRGDPDVIRSYRIVRDTASHVPVIGNIGINTLNDLSIDDVEYLVKTIDADALAIHLNPAQEAIQLEGDTRFNKELLGRIEEILDHIDVPIIIKEVGNGLSMETVYTFRSIGIKYFDVSGACGTNWILVEKYRLGKDDSRRDIAEKLSSWGIPTPYALIESRYAAPDSFIIASGGVWDGVRAAKLLVLGADMIGLAKPVIKELLTKGVDSAIKYLETLIETMKTVFFLIGARNVSEAHDKPVVLLEPFKTYLSSRGINIEEYLSIIRVKR